MTIFEEAQIGKIRLKNRIIRSATYEGFQEASGELKKLYVRLAEGGAGAIITGFFGVASNGKAARNMSIIDENYDGEKWNDILSLMKKYEVPVILQIAHGGGLSVPSLTGQNAFAPSKHQYKNSGQLAEEMTEENILKIIDCFVNAIQIAFRLGFAGVELHAAHGYLLSEFLSPALNQRQDRWGGSTENRFRIVKEILKLTRKKTGNFPVLVKFSAYDKEMNGMNIEESLKIATMLQEAACDGIEISCGNDDQFTAVRPFEPPVKAMMEFNPAIKNLPPEKKEKMASRLSGMVKITEPIENYNVSAAEKIKASVSIPVIVVGGIRRLSVMNDIIENRKADFISLCRPFIIEPDIVNKMRSGQEKSKCRDCAFCLLGIMSGPLKCYYGKIPS